MHTVIILSEHASDLLKDYRFLFKPFVDNGTVSFCEWNESGTDLADSVPDLYKLIKGKPQWRAAVISTAPASGRRNRPAPDERNPFDFSADTEESPIPRESSVPIVRLTHMLCGYPSAPVRNFENGYEYTDETTGKVCRKRASELSEDELFTLSSKYKDALRPIYLEEKVPEEAVAAQKALEEKYSFTDVRPQEVYLISTRKHLEDEEHIYASWKSPFEMESSDFSRKNHYPGICRFMCFSIINPENSRYVKELTEFWLAVLTLTVNKIPASTLQAYKLYHLEVKISEEELSNMLNSHLNKMEAAYAFVQARLKMKPEYTFDEEEEIVEAQHIPVIFDGTSGIDLYIDTRHVGLSRDCPDDELVFWNTQMREKKENIEKYLKAPRRAIDKASRYLKSRAAAFPDDEYELDKFQIEDLEDEISALELRVLTSSTRSVIDEKRIKDEVQKTDRKVKKDIAARMRRSVAVGSGAAFLLIYLIGYIPYIFNSIRLGGGQFLSSLVLAAAAAALAASGGIAALFLLRRRIVQSMESFNTLMHELDASVKASAKKFEDYFSVLCTFMKAQSIYEGIQKKNDSAFSRVSKLKAHKQALLASIERDEEFEAAFGIRRQADFEKNVTRFFNEDKLPKDNSLYYYEENKSLSQIPLNTAGDMINAPYKFIAGLVIEREDIYEEAKGGE